MDINNAKLNIICNAEELFVATERNAKLRYEGYKKQSEMYSSAQTPSYGGREASTTCKD